MKLFTLEKFNNDELKDFSDFVNKYPAEEHIHIFLDSEGGETMIGEAIVALINSKPEKFSISVLVAASAAFMLLLKVKCQIEIMASGYAMQHKGGWSVYVRDGNNMHGEYAEFQQKQLVDFIEDIGYLTKSEQKKFNDGFDIYMGKDRLGEVFKYIEKTYDSKTDLYIN